MSDTKIYKSSTIREEKEKLAIFLYQTKFVDFNQQIYYIKYTHDYFAIK